MANPLAVAPKAFDLLVTLVRVAGRLISKAGTAESCLARILRRGGDPHRPRVSAAQSARRHEPPSAVHRDRRAHGLSLHCAGDRAGFGTPRNPRPLVDCRAACRDRSQAVGKARRSSDLAITDSLIDRLGRFDPVLVRPTGAVHTYMNAADGAAAVGRTLRSDAVVESSFERMPDGVQLSARLVRCEDGERCGGENLTDTAGTAAAVAAARGLGVGRDAA